jgi:hypothetical protein
MPIMSGTQLPIDELEMLLVVSITQFCWFYFGGFPGPTYSVLARRVHAHSAELASARPHGMHMRETCIFPLQRLQHP